MQLLTASVREGDPGGSKADEIVLSCEKLKNLCGHAFSQAQEIAEAHLGLPEGAVAEIQERMKAIGESLRGGGEGKLSGRERFKAFGVSCKELENEVGAKVSPAFSANVPHAFLIGEPVLMLSPVPKEAEEVIEVHDPSGRLVDHLREVYWEQRVPRIEIRPDSIEFATQAESVFIRGGEEFPEVSVSRTRESRLPVPATFFAVRYGFDPNRNLATGEARLARTFETEEAVSPPSASDILNESRLCVEVFYRPDGKFLWVRSHCGGLSSKRHFAHKLSPDGTDVQRPYCLSEGHEFTEDEVSAIAPAVAIDGKIVRISKGEIEYEFPKAMNLEGLVETTISHLRRSFGRVVV
jgi:hypothetical protein